MREDAGGFSGSSSTAAGYIVSPLVLLVAVAVDVGAEVVAIVAIPVTVSTVDSGVMLGRALIGAGALDRTRIERRPSRAASRRGQGDETKEAPPMPDQHGPEDHKPSRSLRALGVVRSHVRPGSFPLLLVAALVAYVLNGLAVDSVTGDFLVRGARVGVAGAGIYVLSANRATLWLGVLAVGLQITFEAHVWGLDPWVNRVLQDATTMAFLLWVLVVVLREVFRPVTAELDAVVGALCGFVLILTAFMRLHGLLEALDAGSYQANGPPLSGYSDPALIAVFQYFSTVTLTTVGFGDIVPITPAARLATGLEAIVGQLYLAVVIATLVGRVAARRG